MKKGIFYFVLIAAFLVGVNTVWAQEFYVIAGGGPPVGTKITSLPFTISYPGFYFLGGNLTYSGTSGGAITIAADNVTLDLMGFSLTGPGASSSTIGVSMSGRTGVEVRNGTVSGFATGVYENSLASGSKHTRHQYPCHR